MIRTENPTNQDNTRLCGSLSIQDVACSSIICCPEGSQTVLSVSTKEKHVNAIKSNNQVDRVGVTPTSLHLRQDCWTDLQVFQTETFLRFSQVFIKLSPCPACSLKVSSKEISLKISICKIFSSGIFMSHNLFPQTFNSRIQSAQRTTRMSYL